MIPITIYLTWRDCKAARMENTRAMIYVATDTVVGFLSVSPPPEDFVGPWTDLQMNWEAVKGRVGRRFNSEY